MAQNCPIFLNCFLRKIKAFISGLPSRKVACGTFFDTLSDNLVMNPVAEAFSGVKELEDIYAG